MTKIPEVVVPAKHRPFKQFRGASASAARREASERTARRIVEGLLSKWLDEQVSLETPPTRKREVDFLARIGTTTLVIEYKAAGDASSVVEAIRRLEEYVRPGEVPVAVVPFMGDAGRRLCARAGVSWVDLSGNADIQGPRLRILIEGQPNRYVHLGRPATAFAPKSSRLARWLVIHPQASFSQRDLARETQLDPGQVSRLVARLQERGLVKVSERGRVALGDLRLMLEAWRDDYRFQRHHVIRGHVPGRVGPELTTRLGRELDRMGLQHAFTGLAGAWSYTHFANFRLVTVFVASAPSAEQLRSIDFIEQDKGSNVWLVLPDDRGVFEGTRRLGDINCAHPVQVWLDLKDQPERAKDASEDLYTRLLKGELDG